MDWAIALWADIARHVSEFRFEAPRTVDQLAAWLGLLGMGFAAYKIITKKVGDALSILGTIGHIASTAARIKSINEALKRTEDLGVMNPNLMGFHVHRYILWTRGTIVVAICVIAFSFLVGREAVWAALGLGVAYGSLQYSRVSEMEKVILWIQGDPDSKFIKLLYLAREYVKRITKSTIKDKNILKQVQIMKDNLPELEERLAKLRAAAGIKVPHDESNEPKEK